MKDTIINLVNCYKEFIIATSEYTIINEDIKSRMNANKILVFYYSLEKKYIDYSTYDNTIVTYLLENNLYKFIEKKIDNKKIEGYLASGLITYETLNYFLDREKTILSIKSDTLINTISINKDNVISEVKQIDMFDLVKRREVLRLKINDLRYKYYNAAKLTKDMLMLHSRDKIKVRIKDDLIELEIRIIDRIYNNEFEDYLIANNLDAFSYRVITSKLKNSKDKKIDRDIINNYKINNKKECLYIKPLPGLLRKYNKKK